MKNVFIAGVDSGIGYGLAEEYLARDYTVFAIGKATPKSLISHPRFYFMPIDMYNADLVRDELRDFVVARSFDRAILTAGIYPDMRNMIDITLETMRYVMNINVWSQKHIIDALLAHSQIKQIVVLSASPNLFNHYGMGSYAISKAALNTMIELYAEEFSHVHLSAIAPALIQTPTFSAFIQDENSARYPITQRIRDSVILPLNQAVPRLMDAMENVKKLKSGSFAEMKKLLH